MQSNIEIKARVDDLAAIEAVAASLADQPREVLRQRDTFFHTPQGRLKLRQFPDRPGELIYYERPDQGAAKQSHYLIYQTVLATELGQLLMAALGEKVVVAKVRHLYLVGQTRIHLDWVEGLGEFVELEVVLRPGQAAEEGYQIAEGLMAELGIEEWQLIAGAYADLLLAEQDGSG